MQTEKRIQNIQSLRGGAALSVLFFHIMLMEKKWGTGPRILPDLLNIGASGVDLFFVISGFVMVIATRGKFQTKGSIPFFLYNRFTRIYPLYWFYSGILLCVFIFRPELVNPSMGNRVNLLESFLLLPQSILPLLMVGWPLVHEMYFYLVFSLLLMTPEKYLAKFLMLWGALIIIVDATCSHHHLLGENAYFIILFSPLTLEFILGCLVAIVLSKGFSRFDLLTFMSSLILLSATCVLYYYNTALMIYDQWNRIFLFGIPYALLVYGAAAIEKNRRKTILDFLKDIGNQSYSLYLSHTIVLNGIGWLWASLLRPQPGYHFLLITVMLVSSIGNMYISYQVLEKPIVIFTKKYSGKILNRSTGMVKQHHD